MPFTDVDVHTPAIKNKDEKQNDDKEPDANPVQILIRFQTDLSDSAQMAQHTCSSHSDQADEAGSGN